MRAGSLVALFEEFFGSIHGQWDHPTAARVPAHQDGARRAAAAEDSEARLDQLSPTSCRDRLGTELLNMHCLPIIPKAAYSFSGPVDFHFLAMDRAAARTCELGVLLHDLVHAGADEHEWTAGGYRPRDTIMKR
jgi:hypothetical protein